jgi:frataxin-like iron-binding protein CyaY
MTAMDRSTYLKLADECLCAWRSSVSPSILTRWTSTTDGVVTLSPRRRRYVLNRQAAADQMRSRRARVHYGWDADKKSWVDDRDGHDLYVRQRSRVAEDRSQSDGLTWRTVPGTDRRNTGDRSQARPAQSFSS